MHRGYVKLYRRFLESDDWTKEKFSRGQAWVDLIGLANHKPGYIRVRGIRVEVGRGQVGWSEVALSKRWKWSREKLRNYLRELAETEQQIRQEKNHVCSLITIINYDLYQSNQTTNQTEDRQQTVQQTDSRPDKNKNDKNDKKERSKKNIGVFVLPEWFPAEVWEMFAAHRKAKKAPIAKGTEEAFFKKFQTWKELGYEPQFVVETIINRGWQSFNPDWLKNNGGANGNTSRVPKPERFSEKCYVGDDPETVHFGKKEDVQ